ncbi:mannonate dehydratase [Actinopolymorpha rutila]|uniref:mannonate dehydratase n=1 Tax=Actinopolymorpha rutila TaxID=446787 RepID=A0A852ZIT8_9ACTN|nr:mannonate dehydratase [Actinopolymorpha rutila]NYH89499.1 mannonate dehydratase [Actinopolymorpha rutila]
MKLAEMVPSAPEAAPLARLVVQAGVGWAVGGLPQTVGADRRGDDAPWDYPPLLSMQKRYENAGLRLAVIEARPPLGRAKRGLDGRDAEIDAVCTLLENMGRLGIPVWCYEWMSDFNWLRTDTAVPSRGGSLVSGYDHALMQQAPPVEAGPVSEDELWENLEYFLRRVVPVAEKAGVKLAMHPDDPPISPVRGVGRIMRSVDNFQRLLDLVPSPVNGITLCQGNFRLMTDDIPAAIRKFGEQGKIFFVHFRDVRGTVENFVETWHDDGPTDLYECLRTYREVGFDGPMRPDHVPTVEGDSNVNPGYSLYGRLFALGYIRGLMEGVGRDGRVGQNSAAPDQAGVASAQADQDGAVSVG